MQKFKEFEVLFSKAKDKALADLGIEVKDDDYFGMCNIDLNEIESFCKCDEPFNGNELTRVHLRSGDIWSINCKYEAFKDHIK